AARGEGKSARHSDERGAPGAPGATAVGDARTGARQARSGTHRTPGRDRTARKGVERARPRRQRTREIGGGGGGQVRAAGRDAAARARTRGGSDGGRSQSAPDQTDGARGPAPSGQPPQTAR